ncbi:MAG TPA: hypothetical protein VGM23_12960, partial [Armatimonadota bacterium]
MSFLLRLRRYRPLSAITITTFLLLITGLVPVSAMDITSSGDQHLSMDVPPGAPTDGAAPPAGGTTEVPIPAGTPVEVAPAPTPNPAAAGFSANADTSGAGVSWQDGKGLSFNLNMTNPSGLSGLANGNSLADLSQLVTPPTLGVPLTQTVTSSSAPVNPTVTASAAYSNKLVSATAQMQFSNMNGQEAGAVGVPAGQSTSWSASYRPTDSLTLSTSGTQSAQPGYGGGVSAFADGTPVAGTGGADQQSQTFSVDYHKQGLPTVNLQHTTQSSSFSGYGSSGTTTASDTLTSSWTKGPWSVSANLGRSQSTNSYTPAFADGTVQAS